MRHSQATPGPPGVGAAERRSSSTGLRRARPVSAPIPDLRPPVPGGVGFPCCPPPRLWLWWPGGPGKPIEPAPLIARNGPTLISPEVLLSRAGCTGDASSHPIPSGPGERTWLRPTAGLAPGGTRGAGRAHCLALTPQVHHGDAWPCSGSGRGRPGRCAAMTGAGGAGEAWREVGVGEERQASLGSRKSQQRLACRGRRGPSLWGCVVGRAGPGCHVGSPAARYPQQQEREPPSGRGRRGQTVAGSGSVISTSVPEPLGVTEQPRSDIKGSVSQSDSPCGSGIPRHLGDGPGPGSHGLWSV